jgi:hypothetical protein
VTGRWAPPPAQASTEVYASGDGSSASVFVGADGRFELELAGAGDALLLLAIQDAHRFALREVPASAGDPVDLGELGNEALALEGVVLSPEGAPAVAATLRFDLDDFSYPFYPSGEADGEGTFRLDHLPPWRGTIRAWTSGARIDLPIDLRETRRVELRLLPGSGLRVRLRWDRERRLGRPTLGVVGLREDGAFGDFNRRVVCGQDGELDLPLDPGRYRLYARWLGEDWLAGPELTVAPGPPRTVEWTVD